MFTFDIEKQFIMEITNTNPAVAKIVSAIIKGINRDIIIDEDRSSYDGEAEALIENEIVATVEYSATHNVTSPSFAGSGDEAPFGYESNLILESAIATVFGNRGVLTNLTNAVNAELKTYIGKTL